MPLNNCVFYFQIVLKNIADKVLHNKTVSQSPFLFSNIKYHVTAQHADKQQMRSPAETSPPYKDNRQILLKE